LRSYAATAVIFVSVAAWLRVASAGGPVRVEPAALLKPMIALVALTAAVWLTMLVVRNAAVILGRVSVDYFKDYQSEVSERIERPARTFNNLMQVPTLFYVLCILMIVLGQTDQAQVTLAWTFVALRALHAIVYMAVNWVPCRFAVWVSSFVTLMMMWYRFAANSPFV
jgi:hypothetical protein